MKNYHLAFYAVVVLEQSVMCKHFDINKIVYIN